MLSSLVFFIISQQTVLLSVPFVIFCFCRRMRIIQGASDSNIVLSHRFYTSWTPLHTCNRMYYYFSCKASSLLSVAYCVHIANTPHIIIRLNELKPRQNGYYFANDSFKRICLNGNVWIAIKISPKFVSSGPINNIPSLIQIMAWRWQAITWTKGG